MSSHDWEMLIRLLLAAFLGGIVGIERGSGDRPAGFRTHILVCAGYKKKKKRLPYAWGRIPAQS